MSIYFHEIYPNFDHHHHNGGGAMFGLKMQINNDAPFTVLFRQEAASEKRVLNACMSSLFTLGGPHGQLTNIEQVTTMPWEMGHYILNEKGVFPPPRILYGKFEEADRFNNYNINSYSYIAIAFDLNELRDNVSFMIPATPPFKDDTSENFELWLAHLNSLSLSEFLTLTKNTGGPKITVEKNTIKFLKSVGESRYYDVFDMLYIPNKQRIDEEKFNVEQAVFNPTEIIFKTLCKVEEPEWTGIGGGGVPIGPGGGIPIGPS